MSGAQVPISTLPAVTTVGRSDQVPEVQSATTKRATVAQIFAALNSADITTALGFTPGVGTITSVTAGTGLSGGGASGPVALAIGASGVTAQQYGDATHVPQFTVNAQGQVTAAGNVAITNTGVTSITSSANISGGGTGGLTLDLTNTGVTAATYGDATHVAQVTIDAKGRASVVANVAISAGGGGNYTLISDTTITSGPGNITITPPASGYTDIIIAIDGYTSYGAAGPSGILSAQLNGDAGNNYKYSGMGIQANTTANIYNDTVNFGLFGYQPTNDGTDPFGGHIEFTLYNYLSTTLWKGMHTEFNAIKSGADNYVGWCESMWRNTAAVTSIKIIQPGAGTFENPTRVRVYGRS